MKEICLEIIAHKALILRFNLTQCAQISYQGDEEKGDGEREMGGIHVGWEVKAGMSLRASLVNKMHFPNTEKKKKNQRSDCAVFLLIHQRAPKEIKQRCYEGPVQPKLRIFIMPTQPQLLWE